MINSGFPIFSLTPKYAPALGTMFCLQLWPNGCTGVEAALPVMNSYVGWVLAIRLAASYNSSVLFSKSKLFRYKDNRQRTLEPAIGILDPPPVILGLRKRVECNSGVWVLRRACRIGGELILHV